MRYRVLVVDDDQDCRELVGEALKRAGFEVLSACNGAEGLEAARRDRPEVILLDLMMPVMDGYEFRRHQAADPDIAAIPVVCISGTYDAPTAAKAIGAVTCVEKPIRFDELVVVVRRAAEPPR